MEDKEIIVPHKKGFYEKYIKRPLDVLCSGIGLIVLSPVMAVVAILVRMKLGSPVIFSQERPGLNEKIFKLYKFRSMTDKRDADGNLLPDEERLTFFGKGLRSTSLDELPELWNIFKGDMSIVGPRPLMVRYIPFYNTFEHRRHSVRPGLTGNAQVNGRNGLIWEKRFEMDVKYADHISFMSDLKIVVSSVKVVIEHSNIALNTMEDFDVYRKKQLDDTNSISW